MQKNALANKSNHLYLHRIMEVVSSATAQLFDVNNSQGMKNVCWFSWLKTFPVQVFVFVQSLHDAWGVN